MGSGGSTYKGETKQVVIVGGGYAGVETAKQFAASKSAIKITVISDKDYLDWNFGSPRLVLEPGEARKACFPLQQTLEFFDKDIALKVAQVMEVTSGSVKTSEGEEIPFDICVVCTGATYGDMPWKATIGEDTTQDRVTALEGWKHKIEAAKQIVVSGAGIVGVEVAGELGHKFQNTDTTVTLVGTFMRETPLLRSKSKAVLEKYGVVMMSGRTGEWHDGDQHVKVDGKEVNCDLLLPCFGMDYNGGPMQTHFQSSLETSNRLRCKNTLQVDHPQASNVFACGDIISVPEGRKPASSPVAEFPAMAKVVVENAIARLKNPKNSGTAEYIFSVEGIERPCLISLGPEEGAGVLPCALCCYGCCGCCGDCLATKIKSSDGYVSLKAPEYGRGKTWEETPPGSQK